MMADKVSLPTPEKYRQETTLAILQASRTWQAAPFQIRCMAGAFVDPLMVAIVAMNEEMNYSKARIDAMQSAMAKAGH